MIARPSRRAGFHTCPLPWRLWKARAAAPGTSQPKEAQLIDYQDFELLVTPDREIRAASEQGEVADELHLDLFDLGDMAALVDPELSSREVAECPEVDWDLDYEFKGTLGSILRCYHVDRDGTFALLYDKLRTDYGSRDWIGGDG
jgi:hypothetical protein